MLENYDIICFGPSDFWGMNPSCATHIMRNLAAKNRIVYINPVSSDLLGLRERSGLLSRVFRKAKSTLKFVRKAEDNLYVVSLVFLPIQGIAFFDKLNNTLLRIQLHLILLWLKMDRPILWAENVRCADIIPSFPWRLVLYHVSDLFEECPYTHNKDKLRQREKYLSENSDLLVCVSHPLYKLKQNTNTSVYYLPHGVDFSLFWKSVEITEPYRAFYGISHPIAGYFGTLTELNDIELLEYCAVNLPDIHFVFAGQITGGDYSGLMQLSNTVFLGRVAYKQIPNLCAMFDLCLLPWKMTGWTANCNPLKLFEYMASGKPIVSVPINEVVTNYSDVLSIASGRQDFCQAIRWELENDDEQRRQKRIAIARDNSWENHNRYLTDIIQTSLAKKSPNAISDFPKVPEPIALHKG